MPKFKRWVCKTHKCGSYNWNNLARHIVPWCMISEEITNGVVRPKTFGGYNGDVSRKFLNDWIEYSKRKQQWNEDIENWHDVLQNEFGHDIKNIITNK